MYKIAILGSTGSIGTQALRVLKHLGKPYRVVALAARSNTDLLAEQVKEFSPDIVAIYDEENIPILRKRFPELPLIPGMEGLEAVATYANADIVLVAISGAIALIPTIAAIRAGKRIALANKEVLVCGGELITSLLKEKKGELIPVDSEHSALFQCLNGEKIEQVRRLILTASGGPFRNYSKEQLREINVDQALNHPTWKMGPKVTVDSSTLMNKGLEVIEARWLFDIPVEKIEVVIHPQSIIHSMVEYVDGSILAQMSQPTMELPIQYAFTYPRRVQGTLPPFDFIQNRELQFFRPDLERFRCLQLAFEVTKLGKSYPCYLNAANEILVHRFLSKEIGWPDIAQKLEVLLDRHQEAEVKDLEDILAVDATARREAEHA